MEGNGGKIRPADVNLYIHKPINTAELSKEELAELPKRVEETILSALPNNGK
jgi:1-acyl-sn-glycerol-3-phosphate acyltransferase